MGDPLVLVIRTTQPDGRVCFWPNSDVEIRLTIRSLSDVERTWRSFRPFEPTQATWSALPIVGAQRLSTMRGGHVRIYVFDPSLLRRG